ncbi:MAG: PAS domain S-box protein [Vulcanimicrobiota bacterium]
MDQDNEHLLQQLVNAVPDPAYFRDSQGLFQGCNSDFESYIGVKCSSLKGMRSHDFFTPEVAEQCNSVEQELLSHGGKKSIEFSFLHPDGTLRSITCTKSAINDRNGKITGLLGIINDTTEQRQTKESLETALDQYRTTIESIGDGINVIDRDLRIILYNNAYKALCEQYGFDTSDLLGKRLSDLFPFIPAKVFDDLKALFKTGKSEITEDTSVISGQEVSTETRKIPLTEGGKVIKLLTVIRDITERKRTERALVESELKYRTLTNNIPDIVCSIDRNGNMSAVNETSTKLTGYETDEIIGTPFTKFIYIDDRDIVEKNFHDEIANRGDTTKGLQFRIVTRDDRTLWVELNSRRRFDENGNFIQEDVVLRDVTQRKRIEEEKAILAQRIAERTSQLSAANAELSRAVRAKDEFLASMSHELRTPLSAILTISESIDEEVYGPMTDKQRRAVRNITESGQHLLSLINDILDLSKIEAGKITLDPVSVAVEELCQASIRLTRGQAQKKRLSMTLTIDSHLNTIIADERYLKQILVNLLGNAVKFTPDGGKMGLEVQADSEGQVVQFTVWDTGIGIPKDKQFLLFKPFTQLDSSLSRQYGGTGLGLALVARLTELHGGSVSVDSDEGKGSRFTVSLPWDSDADAKPPKISKPEADMPRKTDVIRNALVVEDSLGDAQRLERYLVELGISSTTLGKGERAVERTLEVRPDVIILDILLPGIDGWEVLSMLKADARTKKIPIIMVSVLDERLEALRRGAAEYLMKPVSRDSLKRVLSSSLNKAEQGGKALLIAPDVKDEVMMSGPVIVLAEDNETLISNISDYLIMKGYTVVVARNGSEAVERVCESCPEVVLMDIQMPGVDGLEAIKRIRAGEICRNVPIIALTALAMTGDRERCLQAGADEYLSKPVKLKHLIETIERFRRAGRELHI